MSFQNRLSDKFKTNNVLVDFNETKEWKHKYDKIIKFISCEPSHTAIAGGYFIKYNEKFKTPENKVDFETAEKEHDIDVYIFANSPPDYSLLDKNKQVSTNNAAYFNGFLTNRCHDIEFTIEPEKHCSIKKKFFIVPYEKWDKQTSLISPKQTEEFSQGVEVRFILGFKCTCSIDWIQHVVEAFDREPSKIYYFNGELKLARWFIDGGKMTENPDKLPAKYLFKGLVPNIFNSPFSQTFLT